MDKEKNEQGIRSSNAHVEKKTWIRESCDEFLENEFNTTLYITIIHLCEFYTFNVRFLDINNGIVGNISNS